MEGELRAVGRLVVTVCIFLALNYCRTALAHPSPVPHAHNESNVAWEADGVKSGNSAHNHRTSIDFGEVGFPRDPYSTHNCWDNQQVRYQLEGQFNLAHCYIDEANPANTPRYYFVFPEDWPAAAKTLVRQALAAWSNVTSDHQSRTTGIHFTETFSPGNAQILIYWTDQLGPTELAKWDPAFRTLRFDKNRLWNYQVSPSGIPDNYFHFYSVALHEAGHVTGLGHSSDLDSVMTDAEGLGEPPNHPGHRHFQVIDFSSRSGALDIYSQPVSQPPVLSFYYATFQGCPPGCGHSPYLVSWEATNATSYEAEFRFYFSWYPLYSGSIGETLAATGTQYSEDIRVRAVNSFGATEWAYMTLHVQCSDTQDPW